MLQSSSEGLKTCAGAVQVCRVTYIRTQVPSHDPPPRGWLVPIHVRGNPGTQLRILEKREGTGELLVNLMIYDAR